ncbi:hypothetical protein PNA2_0862 [Pyrococcus sp. NA2]|uniref:hypothetical protein n=1 Tax=Pyrococcus sp. (strain NA2) TaxID=342949 RepID=UPI000209AFDB|nr:hypothetical protein [Pyrococcus sp. NA2]AEC51778.1 hypothetical protein PNA2_0862 [Pyrococcus sp. NA2]
MLPIAKGDIVKEFRLRASLRALERVRDVIGEEAYRRLRDLLEYRIEGKEFSKNEIDFEVAVAYSGGSDSSATIKILRWAGFRVIPITARIPQLNISKLKEKTILVEIPEYMNEMRRLMEKRAPICGRCHSLVMQAVEWKAKEIGAKILATGDMITFGSGSIYLKDNIVILNLPAFLALTKVELLNILGWKNYEFRFGCSLWREAVKKAPIMKRFAIQRILRELRAGALTKEIAKELILDVLKA